MEKDFKSLKLELLVYRHIYLIYAIFITSLVGLFIHAIITKQETWYLGLQSVIIIFILYDAIFRLKKKRVDVKLKADAFLLTLTSLKECMNTRINKLSILENEFDVLKNEENGPKLIQDRITTIHVSTIADIIKTAYELGGGISPFIIRFSVPNSIPKLHQLIKDMKSGAEKEMDEIKIMYNTINKLAKY